LIFVGLDQLTAESSITATLVCGDLLNRNWLPMRQSIQLGIL
jgi:hypothetical protein